MRSKIDTFRTMFSTVFPITFSIQSMDINYLLFGWTIEYSKQENSWGRI